MNETVRRHYETCLANGCSPRLAEMFALGAPPMSNTDREFLEARENGRQFQDNPAQGDYYRRVAEAGGQNVTGKVYLSGLAEYPGDPRAWISDRGDARRLCEERGWDCQGSVNVKAAERGKPRLAPVADGLVQQEVLSRLDDHPEPERVDVGELTEQVRAERNPHWAKP